MLEKLEADGLAERDGEHWRPKSLLDSLAVVSADKKFKPISVESAQGAVEHFEWLAKLGRLTDEELPHLEALHHLLDSYTRLKATIEDKACCTDMQMARDDEADGSPSWVCKSCERRVTW